jgi:hypothetical protein
MKGIASDFKKIKFNMKIKEIGVVHDLLGSTEVTDLLFELRQSFEAYLR